MFRLCAVPGSRRMCVGQLTLRSPSKLHVHVAVFGAVRVSSVRPRVPVRSAVLSWGRRVVLSAGESFEPRLGVVI